MKKKIIALVLCIFTVFSLASNAFAYQSDDTQIIDYGDGYYAVVHTSNAISTRAVSKTKQFDFFNDSQKIGTAYLTGTFQKSGSSYKATSAEVDGTGYNGWTYKSGTASYSGNKVSATVKYTSRNTTKSFPISMTY